MHCMHTLFLIQRCADSVSNWTKQRQKNTLISFYSARKLVLDSTDSIDSNITIELSIGSFNLYHILSPKQIEKMLK